MSVAQSVIWFVIWNESLTFVCDGIILFFKLVTNIELLCGRHVQGVWYSRERGEHEVGVVLGG